MTKSIQPVTAPVEIRVPGAPSIMTTIDIQTGKHIIECDLCRSSITLTIGANPKAFFDHRTGARLVCSQTIIRKGLPNPLPKDLPPRIVVSKAPRYVDELPCPGLAIQWRPGSIWGTYPYRQHEIYAVGWTPVSFGAENDEIFLHSDRCSLKILETDEPPCIQCRLLEYSSKFREFMERATMAKPHTPWELLTMAQT